MRTSVWMPIDKQRSLAAQKLNLVQWNRNCFELNLQKNENPLKMVSAAEETKMEKYIIDIRVCFRLATSIGMFEWDFCVSRCILCGRRPASEIIPSQFCCPRHDELTEMLYGRCACAFRSVKFECIWKMHQKYLKYLFFVSTARRSWVR